MWQCMLATSASRRQRDWLPIGQVEQLDQRLARTAGSKSFSLLSSSADRGLDLSFAKRLSLSPGAIAAHRLPTLCAGTRSSGRVWMRSTAAGDRKCGPPRA